MKMRIEFIFLAGFLFFSACSSCTGRGDKPTRIVSRPVTFNETIKETAALPSAPPVRVINIGPSRGSSSNEPALLPSETAMDERLTSRLKDKMREAFAGRNTSPPDVEIHTSNISLEGFSKFYEDKGYKVQRTSVPATQVIGPLLEEKPELSSKISLGNYSGIVINQVIVEGENISAADKYIDPETYQIVYKTFITVTKMK